MILRPDLEIPFWENIFENPNLPVHIDLGTAKGTFIRQLAECDPNTNYLGLELRDLSEDYKKFKKLPNLHFIHLVSANSILDTLLKQNDAKSGNKLLKVVSIVCPDPWPKIRHARRRMINPQLIQEITSHFSTKEQGSIYFGTDSTELFQESERLFQQNKDLVRADPKTVWWKSNGRSICSDKEKQFTDLNLPLHFSLYRHQQSTINNHTTITNNN